MLWAKKNIIGVDASITSTGIAVLSLIPQKVLHVTHIPTKPTEDVWDDQIRFQHIVDTIMDYVCRYNCGHMYIEAPAFGAYDNEGRLYQLKGVLLDRIYRAGLPYPIYIAPTKLKKFITGSGKSESKNLMGEAVRRHFFKELLNVSFKNDDEIDAYALAKFGQISILTEKKIFSVKKLPIYQQEALQPKKEKTNGKRRRKTPF